MAERTGLDRQLATLMLLGASAASASSWQNRLHDHSNSRAVTGDRKFDHRSSGLVRIVNSLENFREPSRVILGGALRDIRPDGQPVGREKVPTIERFKELDRSEPLAEFTGAHDTSCVNERMGQHRFGRSSNAVAYPLAPIYNFRLALHPAVE